MSFRSPEAGQAPDGAGSDDADRTRRGGGGARGSAGGRRRPSPARRGGGRRSARTGTGSGELVARRWPAGTRSGSGGRRRTSGSPRTGPRRPMPRCAPTGTAPCAPPDCSPCPPAAGRTRRPGRGHRRPRRGQPRAPPRHRRRPRPACGRRMDASGSPASRPPGAARRAGGPSGRAARARRRRAGAPRAHPADRTRGGRCRGPVVRDLTLTAYVGDPHGPPPAKRDPRRYRVFATREGLVGGDDGERARHQQAGHVRRAALAPGPVAAQQQRLHGEGVRPHRPLRVRAGVGRRPVEHPRRLLERREASSSGATCRAGCRRRRPRRRTATTAARTSSGGRCSTRRASTSPTGCSGTRSG